MSTETIQALRALEASKKDRSKIQDAIRHIDRVRSRGDRDAHDIEKNIHNILQAVDALLHVASSDISAERLMLDNLLGLHEAEWYLRLSPF